MSSFGRLRKMVKRGREIQREREELLEIYNDPEKWDNIMVHGYFVYECKDCGTVYRMWLERGLEDRIQDEKEPDKHKPVPFMIRCGNCGGSWCRHILWGIGYSDDYQLLPKGDSFFKNDPGEDCGKPMRRKYFSSREQFMAHLLREKGCF